MKAKTNKGFPANGNQETVETGLPGGRFSKDASVATPADTNSTSFGIDGSIKPSHQDTVASKATVVKGKMSIKPTSDAGLGDGKQVGGVPLDTAAATMSVAGASNINSAVDLSKIPHSNGEYRPSTRYGKKNTVDNFVLNNTISEQVEPTFEESKDLRESPDSVQGYNGVKQFKTARGKKNAGSDPASLLFDRSIDFVEHGSVIHTTGQVIGNVDATAGYPTMAYAPDSGEYEEISAMQKSNYLLKNVQITINDDGLITDVRFNEDVYSPNAQGVAIEQSNQNWQVDANNVANTMVKLQTELGRETTDNWSPLGYVIRQPYEYNMLMHDIEASTGALMHAAYRSAAHSMSFQINKRAKDGAIAQSNLMAQFLAGDLYRGISNAAYDCANVQETFFGNNYTSTPALRDGSIAGLIKMFDSTSKYTSFADLVNQPRSIKMHLQTTANNIAPFHEKIEFAKALDDVCYFSTEDGAYNPMLPIHTTREIKLMNPLSLQSFAAGWTNPALLSDEERSSGLYDEYGLLSGYRYQYWDLRNSYDWGVQHPVVAGLIKWLLRHQDALYKAYGAGTITWPAHFGMQYPSMLAYILCSASQDIAWMRNVTFRDILFAGEQARYVWDDLTDLKTINPLAAKHYTFSDVGNALKLGKLSNTARIRINWPEHVGFRKSTDYTGAKNSEANTYLLPWYYCENSFTNTARMGEGFYTGTQPYAIAMPSIRSGVNHEHVDLLYGMTERELRLSLDRMTDLPMPSFGDGSVEHPFTPYTGLGNAADDTITTLNGVVHLGAIRYDVNSDGRVIMALASEDGIAPVENLRYLKNNVYYSTPREFGYIFPMIQGYASPICDAGYGIGTGIVDLRNVSNNASGAIDGSCYLSAVMYRASGTGISANAISRSAALRQDFFTVHACRDANVVEYNLDVANLLGMTLGLSGVCGDNIGEFNDDVTTKEAIYALGSNALIPANHAHLRGITFISMQNYFWTLLQRLYTPINLFEVCYDANEATGIYPDQGTFVDPLETATYFGFAGCLASDFNQDVLERLVAKDQLGIYYIKDDFITSSPIFRG